MITITAFLIFDTSIINISVYTGGFNPLVDYILIFILMGAMYSICQYLILRYVKRLRVRSNYSKTSDLRIFIKAGNWVQYLILFCLIVLIIQIFYSSVYSLWIPKTIIYTSYIFGVVALALLSFKFIKWYSNHRSVVTIAYLASIISLLINALLLVMYINTELAMRPQIIHYVQNINASATTGFNPYSSSLYVTYIVAFLTTWFATVLSMRSYTSLGGKIRYWIIVSIPLIYFLGQFQPFLLSILYPIRLSDPLLFGIIYTSFFAAVKPLAGIIFGIAFWSLSKRVNDTNVKNHLIIAAYGMMLMFSSSNTATLTLVPLPPFGIISAAFFGLASFLFLIGVYFSAISVANDYSIRKSIILYAKQSSLLDRIGSAEASSEKEKLIRNAMKVVSINAKELELDTGVSSTMTDQDYKAYINLVLNELRKKAQ